MSKISRENRQIFDFENAVNVFKRSLTTQIEFEQLKAKTIRAKFIALKEEGFNHSEALEIIKAGEMKTN